MHSVITAAFQVLLIARQAGSSEEKDRALKRKVIELIARPELDLATKAFKHGQGSWEVNVWIPHTKT